MIRHIVLVKFPETLPATAIADMFRELHEIKAVLGGVRSIVSGKSESPEQIERGYMHGFVVDLDDWAALAAYQEHPDHKKLGARLVANAVGGLDGILVFDLPVAE
ncbi:MAG: Dabb family protein [Pseudomonadota bacterium]